MIYEQLKNGARVALNPARRRKRAGRLESEHPLANEWWRRSKAASLEMRRRYRTRKRKREEEEREQKLWRRMVS